MGGSQSHSEDPKSKTSEDNDDSIDSDSENVLEGDEIFRKFTRMDQEMRAKLGRGVHYNSI